MGVSAGNVPLSGICAAVLVLREIREICGLVSQTSPYGSIWTMKVTFERGILLPELDLWLDPHDERDTAFVSHAHSDHIGNHREVILSEITARLMAARLPGRRVEHWLPFTSPVTFRGATVTLLPAGHIFGSAQLHIKLGEETLLYTGDFKLRPGLSAEPIAWLPADTLIMETTYGLPKYIFPPVEQVIAEVTKFCLEA